MQAVRVSPNSRCPPGSAKAGPVGPAPSWTRTASPWRRMPQARTRNSLPRSSDPSTQFPLDVGTNQHDAAVRLDGPETQDLRHEDRKSTRLNSSHITISYAVF